jgi:FlgD Ig-like domain
MTRSIATHRTGSIFCTLFIFAVVLLTAASPAEAFSSGPPDGRTGAPGETNCTACHSSFPVNSGDGLFTITAPAEVASGETVTITVTLEDPDQVRWGFEITPLTAGMCTITDPTNTQLSVTSMKSYVKQTSAGTYDNTAGPVSWSFEWTAPEAMREDVIFYAAGNAANSNGGTSGDYIYTTSWTIAVASADVADEDHPLSAPLTFVNSPNPFAGTTLITYDLPAAGGHATLEIFDATGARVSTLFEQLKPGGTHHVAWDGRNRYGQQVPSGMYLARLSTESGSRTRPLMVLR